MDLAIDRIRVGDRHRHDLGDLDALARSIEDVGLLHPVVVTPDGLLVAGMRRLEACRRLGMRRVPVTVVDLVDVVRGERDENAQRKAFLPSEVDAIRRTLEPAEREAAAGRRRSGLRQYRGGNFPPWARGGKTRDLIAAYCGVSGKTLNKIRTVMDAARADPAKYSDLAEEMDRTGRVDGAYKRLLVRRKAEVIEAEPPQESRAVGGARCRATRAGLD